MVMTFNPRLLATGRVARRTTSDPKEVEQVAVFSRLVSQDFKEIGIIRPRETAWHWFQEKIVPLALSQQNVSKHALLISPGCVFCVFP